jgi:hypothetical protein
MNQGRKLVMCAAAALGVHALPVRAELLPLWEAGAGVAAISFPDYRGAAHRRSYLLPVPVFVYRGSVFQVDREKVRGLLIKSERVELDVSINGTVPIRSDGNTAREGMPDLDPTLEIGPSLTVSLAATERTKLTLRLPLRAVIASDFRSIHSAGFLPIRTSILMSGRCRAGASDWWRGLCLRTESITIISMVSVPSLHGRAARPIGLPEAILAHSSLRRCHVALNRFG